MAGGRRSLAAALAVVITLLVLIVPTLQLSETLISGAQNFAAKVREGDVRSPPPDPSVADWPLIGDPVYEFWKVASTSLGDAPPLLYALSSIGGTTTVVLIIWTVAVEFLDNFLKPLLFGRGVEVPSLVIFMGAIGGMITMGIVGLFLGAVILALGYALFIAWLSDLDTAEPVDESPGAPPVA